jgi:hypothetical protein
VILLTGAAAKSGPATLQLNQSPMMKKKYKARTASQRQTG